MQQVSLKMLLRKKKKNKQDDVAPLQAYRAQRLRKLIQDAGSFGKNTKETSKIFLNQEVSRDVVSEEKEEEEYYGEIFLMK